MSADNFANNVNNNDPLEIGELAVLNEDISADFIEQLQGKIASELNTNKKSDADLFEEVSETTETVDDNADNNAPSSNENDDDFVKKYKTRLKNQELPQTSVEKVEEKTEDTEASDNESNGAKQQENVETEENVNTTDVENTTKEAEVAEQNLPIPKPEKSEIENLTSGNIKEKTATQEQIDYNKSLSELDDKNYKKYIIYIDPENVDFIDNLSLKERKNLFNKIIKEQDCISSTKSKCYIIQTIIKHIIIAIFTLSISIPILYYTLNASLETSINNYKKSQTLFSSLYKAKGKIQNKANIK